MKTIGITQIDPSLAIDNATIKSDLIYFDEIIYTVSDDLEKFCDAIPEWREAYDLKLEELEKLEQAGLAKKFVEEGINKEGLDIKLLEKVLSYKEQANKVFEGYTTEGKDINEVLQDFCQRSREVGQLDSRINSLMLNGQNEDHFMPIIRNRYYNFLPSDAYSTNIVTSVILKKFPKISEDTPIERLIEFKTDPDTIKKLSRLRDWSIELSKANHTEKEIEQKIDHLLFEYADQVKVHELKYKAGRIETIVTTPLEIIENLARLNFSKAAKAIFDVRKKKIALLEEEQKFTGRELALIYKLQKSGL